uniref:Cobalamin biosynthesis protein CobD n=1 Tax=Caldilinea aerophila TaxID=133453 RepID=A0A7C1FGD4_9CHLR
MADTTQGRRGADRRWLTLLLALGIDWLWGDPGNRWHPVAWMGTAIAWLRRCVPQGGRGTALFYGFCLAGGGAAASAWMVRLLTDALSRMPMPVVVLLEAVLLKMTFSLRGLLTAGGSVKVALEQGELDAARRLLAWHLVSRNVSQLDASQVAAATIESLAENLSDGVLAPLLYYALMPRAEWGLPAAYAYRFLNTADAMLGYRDAEREWLGKASARLDDLANLIPARVTALLIVACACAAGGSGRHAWRIWRRDARQTASPNAGHPMAAMAGALGVVLEKVDHYVLGAGSPNPDSGDIGRALRLVGVVAGVGIGLLTLLRRIRR